METRSALNLFLLSLTLGACSQPSGLTEISMSDLENKVRGGWAGQMIGVSYGAPTEFRYQGRIIPDDQLPEWSDERLRNAIHQDDLYVEMTFAQVLDEKGLDATTEDFGAMFRDAEYSLWHANLGARRALRRGVSAELSGTPTYNSHANDIDFQIEADFIGLMSPGMPVSSNELCQRVGRVMNYGDGIYGGMFVSGMYAEAFLEKDVRKVVQAGLASLPPESPYALLIGDVLSWSEQYQGDWQRVWRLVQDKWDRRDPCPAGALTPFNIDAKLNGAYIALGLLHGDGDFGRTMEIATRSGQDSDCNPSNAAGILGVMMGFDQIPEKWRHGLKEIGEEKFSYTDYSFEDIVRSTMTRAVKLAERNGGRLEGDTLLIQRELPEAAALQVWDDYGDPVERVAVTDSRWKWTGKWSRQEVDPRGGAGASRATDAQGATGEIAFDGTGVIVVGPYLPDGGKANVYLDGELAGTVDVFSDEENAKGGESVWHRFGLPLGPHAVKIEVLGEPYGASTGSQVVLTDLVVFR